jgi:hypothetical protein
MKILVAGVDAVLVVEMVGKDRRQSRPSRLVSGIPEIGAVQRDVALDPDNALIDHKDELREPLQNLLVGDRPP